MANLLRRIGVELPINQAPMAGTSPPAMAAAVTNAGDLGSIAVGAVNADPGAPGHDRDPAGADLGSNQRQRLLQ